MEVRPAVPHDVDVCRLLDGSCQSDSVWNMQQVAERDAVSVRLSRVRLPRPLEVPYPANLDDLSERLKRGGLVLVAAEGELGIAGCLAASYDRACAVAWVGHLLVSPEKRRQGVATALVREAARQVGEAGMRVLMVPCLAKSSPAVAFCRHLGLELCGYNEHQYADHAVTLQFAYRIVR
jgi:GNAT superfamily N-acetyltransferase